MRLIVITGAGISAESGLSTFRDSDGLWENHHIDRVANARTWRQNFQEVHNFYNARRIDVRGSKPNLAHEMIGEWSKRYDVTVLTQNVDDLHERGGAQNVIHLHNQIGDMYCVACGHRWNIGYGVWDHTTMVCDNPRRKCGSRKGVRPGIVMFNDPAPNYRIMYEMLDSLTPTDIVLVCGTSCQVIDFHSLLFDKQCVRIWANLTESGRTFYTKEFVGPATEQFPAIDQYLRTM